MPLPFIVKNCPTKGTECVACHNFRPAEQLAPCLCGSPICDCGIPCPDCAELIAVYDASMKQYKAKNIHFVGETNPVNLNIQLVHKEKLVRVLKLKIEESSVTFSDESPSTLPYNAQTAQLASSLLTFVD